MKSKKQFVIYHNLKEFWLNFFDRTKNYYLIIFILIINFIILLLSFYLTKKNQQFFFIFLGLLSFLFLLEISLFFLTSQKTIQNWKKETEKKIKTDLNFFWWLKTHHYQCWQEKIWLFIKKYGRNILIIFIVIFCIILNFQYKNNNFNSVISIMITFLIIYLLLLEFFRKLMISKWRKLIQNLLIVIILLISSFLFLFFIIKYLSWLLTIIGITYLIIFFINKLK